MRPQREEKDNREMERVERVEVCRRKLCGQGRASEAREGGGKGKDDQHFGENKEARQSQREKKTHSPLPFVGALNGHLPIPVLLTLSISSLLLLTILAGCASTS